MYVYDMSRNIRHVIAALLACIYQTGRPSTDFLNQVNSVAYDSIFTAPEAMSIRWDALAHILCHYYLPRQDLIAIFNSPTEYVKWLDRVPQEWDLLMTEEDDTEFCNRLCAMRNADEKA